MATVQTTYRNRHLPGRAGLVASGRAYNLSTGVAGEDIQFGRALVRGADEGEVQTAVGTPGADNVATNFVGISVRDGNLTVGTDDPSHYSEGDPVAVMTYGEVYVTAEAAVAVGADVTFDSDGNLSSAAPSGAQKRIPGARWMSAATAGQVARVFIPDFANSA